MHRLTVAFLAAFDAVIAAAVGVAVVLAPLTLLWIFGFGGAPSWDALWPAAVSVWQLGNLVPLHIHLPPEYLAATGIAESEASFLLSLAPLAFAAFTAIFAARSGARASRAEAWMTGVFAGTLVFAALTAGAGLTARTPVAAVHLWQAVLFPVLVFALPAALGAIVTEWREAGSGVVARVRDRIEAAPRGWGDVPGLVVRGSGAVLAGLLGAGALLVAVALIASGGEVIALFQAGGADLLGVIVLALGQLAYLPTLVVWGLSFVAGPGFSIGVGTAVSPSGTQVGVVPGIPVLGILPESVSPWLLLLALVPVALGAFAGWIARSRLVADASGVVASAPAARAPAESEFDDLRTSALAGLLSPAERAEPARAPDPDVELAWADPPAHEPVAARLAIAGGIALVSAGGAALLAWVASGSLGPGRLAEVGPQPGPVAVAVGLEVLLGAAILLLSPRRASGPRSEDADAPVLPAALPEDARPVPEPSAPRPFAFAPLAFDPPASEAATPSDEITAPIDLDELPDLPDTPRGTPPVD